jgi:hypothetical protein
MNEDLVFPLRVFFGVCFFLTLLAGLYLFKYSERLFGLQSPGKRETSGERTYSKAQAFIVWIIAMKLCALMFVML